MIVDECEGLRLNTYRYDNRRKSVVSNGAINAENNDTENIDGEVLTRKRTPVAAILTSTTAVIVFVVSSLKRHQLFPAK